MVQFCFVRSYLGIETVSFHPLLRMARMNVDWNLKKLSRLRLCSHKSGKRYGASAVLDPGEGSGGHGPPYFKNKLRPEGRKNFFETTPLISGSG